MDEEIARFLSIIRCMPCWMSSFAGDLGASWRRIDFGLMLEHPVVGQLALVGDLFVLA